MAQRSTGQFYARAIFAVQHFAERATVDELNDENPLRMRFKHACKLRHVLVFGETGFQPRTVTSVCLR